jgi:hypothetical protein
MTRVLHGFTRADYWYACLCSCGVHVDGSFQLQLIIRPLHSTQRPLRATAAAPAPAPAPTGDASVSSGSASRSCPWAAKVLLYVNVV